MVSRKHKPLPGSATVRYTQATVSLHSHFMAPSVVMVIHNSRPLSDLAVRYSNVICRHETFSRVHYNVNLNQQSGTRCIHADGVNSSNKG